MHPLDRPVWNALVSRWTPLALGDGRARRLDPAVGPFAAAADASREAQAALAALVTPAGELWVVEADEPPAPPGVSVARRARLQQMVADAIAPAEARFAVEPLTHADAPAMYKLATLTQPGPWAARTHRLGGFVGVKLGGWLVAMAGERMKPNGFTEVSGVCTHPDHRGRGYAAGLMRTVAERILARGETPFLHVYPSNRGAIALYEALGFRLRSEMSMMVLTRF
jgi:predicted GNAT family acetyltransferase